LGQCSLRYFKLTEVSENDIRGLNNPKPQENVEYVTKNDLKTVIERIEKLEKPKGE